jgi:hypothetical protein
MAETWSKNEYEFDPNDQRFERKFVTDALSTPDLDLMLRVHPNGFVIAYPDRLINNIYLDTENLRCFEDHTRGCRSRAKFRVRWYGDLLQERARPVLEIKRKTGMVGSKLRFNLPEFNSASELSDEGIKQLIRNADIDPRIAGWVEAMHCVVGNCYRRTYFVTADKNYRMTIDRDLQFYSIPARPGVLGTPIDEATIVLELKYQNELDEKVEEITQALPLRVKRMSKYILGIERLAADGRL